MINFYETKPVKKHLTNSHNPNFDKTQMDINTRILIIGSSGSGKTNLLMNYIMLNPNTFHKIHIVFKSFEPLYEMLKDKLEDSGGVVFYDDINKLPDVNSIQENPEDQQLIVFDDQIGEKEKLSGKVSEYFIRSRKKGCTLLFLSQSFYKIPKLIRSNMNYLLILKLSSARDLRLIISDFSIGSNVDEIEAMYKDATNERFNFFKIDVDQQNDDKRLSKNFNTKFYQLN